MIVENKYIFRCFNFYIAFFLAYAITQPLLSKESTAIPEVVGHKPVAKNVRIDKNDIKVGDLITVLYDYSDSDGDQEDVSTFQWAYNGLYLSSETRVSYATQLNTKLWDCKDFHVDVLVTPRSVTGEPKIGNQVKTLPLAYTVKLYVIDGFLKPNYTNKLNHADAVKYCEARNMRLPTALELKTLIDSTPHMALATRYGWPIGDLCGGGGWTKYWTISPAPIGFAYTVDLKSSLQEQSSVTKNNLFTCIKK